jgi:hypothetical protein
MQRNKKYTNDAKNNNFEVFLGNNYMKKPQRKNLPVFPKKRKI